MKKLLLILFIVLTSCSKDEQDCKCDMKVYVSDGNTTNYYILTGAPSDCNGNVTEIPEYIDNAPNTFPTMRCL